ncbi:MAG TPA: hypothetical protein VHU44_16735 [Acidobacteriaceae bacterium]|nr:hypothetical protein [Acidobacteriaceae bacterium]
MRNWFGWVDGRAAGTGRQAAVRRLGAPGLTTLLALLSAAMLPGAAAQTHKVEQKPQNVVRAVGVYEWTGDLAKPAASRLIPVSLFIDGRLQDAGVYMSRPMPFALVNGNVYELEKSGLPQGTLELAYARHLVPNQNSATIFDDGWFGYGKFAPPAPPKKSTLQASAVPIRLDGTNAEDDDKPHFSGRSAIPGTGGSANPRPGSTTTSSSPSNDPDRPTMKRRGSGDSDSASETVPGDDADRPTLKKRPSKDKPTGGDEGRVEKVSSGLDDPNRPTIHRGKPVGAMSEDDIPKLMGLPPEKELRQMVAVSDAQDHPPHDFAREWEGNDERSEVLAKMQDEARAQLAAYGAAHPGAGAAAPVKSGAAPVKMDPKDTRRVSSKHRSGTAQEAAPPPPVTLVEEDLRGFELSYNGTPTFVYSAHTDGTGAGRREVTLVAQMNPKGDPEYAIKSVTDEGHLDQTPRMRLVDAVDAEASNRASLLFELKAQNARQFALYRVIGARAEQTFVTGTTQ